jgi:hypothetical protein
MEPDGPSNRRAAGQIDPPFFLLFSFARCDEVALLSESQSVVNSAMGMGDRDAGSTRTM